MILWGPPGTGKTSLAMLIASHVKVAFIPFSAVTSGIKEIKEVIAEADRRLRGTGQRTILFVDEIHQSDHMIHGRVGKDPVAKVEDVAWPAFGSFKDPLDLSLNQVNRAEEKNGIEVSLDGHIISQPFPGLCQVYPRIVATGRGKRAQRPDCGQRIFRLAGRFLR